MIGHPFKHKQDIDVANGSDATTELLQWKLSVWEWMISEYLHTALLSVLNTFHTSNRLSQWYSSDRLVYMMSMSCRLQNIWMSPRRLSDGFLNINYHDVLSALLTQLITTICLLTFFFLKGDRTAVQNMRSLMLDSWFATFKDLNSFPDANKIAYHANTVQRCTAILINMRAYAAIYDQELFNIYGRNEKLSEVNLFIESFDSSS